MKRKQAIDMNNLTESDLFKQLLDNPDSAQDILLMNNIVTRLGPLERNIVGMVYKSRNGTYYIIANQLLEFEDRQLVFLHELAHIIVEAPLQPYLLRLDCDHNEYVMDQFAENAYRVAADIDL